MASHSLLMHDPLTHKREQILQQMQQIHRMEHGSIHAEKRASKKDPAEERGPYYKHQVWENGGNHTRRVPQDQAAALTDAIEGRKKFEALADEFIEATVAMTRSVSSPESKKNEMKSKPRSSRKPQD